MTNSCVLAIVELIPNKREGGAGDCFRNEVTNLPRRDTELLLVPCAPTPLLFILCCTLFPKRLSDESARAAFLPTHGGLPSLSAVQRAHLLADLDHALL